MSLPEAGADHRHVRGPRQVILGEEEAALRRADPEHGEELGVRSGTVDPFRQPPARERVRLGMNAADVLEDAGARLPLLEVRVRDCTEQDVPRAECLPGHDEALWLMKRQRLEHHPVQDAENGRARTDAESQRDDGDGRERGRA